MSYNFDVVVAGAGSSGAAAAYHLAKHGYKVAIFDQKSFGEAGARWVNGIAPWMFDRADLERPKTPEDRGGNDAVIMRTYGGHRMFSIEPAPVHNIDMRMLVRRLQEKAIKAGTVAFERLQPESFEFQGNRPTTLRATMETGYGQKLKIKISARLFVDATGKNGALLRKVPELSRHCKPCTPDDMCNAKQTVFELRDRSGARTYKERYDIDSDKILCFTAVAGGFSTICFFIDVKLGVCELLCGAIGDGKHKTGPQIMQEFIADKPWIGEPLFGGARVIHMRRPYDRMAAPGIVLVGDAGSQVFPAHGSGVGTGMIAGKILSETVTGHGDPGSLQATWAYQAAFLKEIGRTSAAYHVSRRFLQKLSNKQMEKLSRAGLLNRDLAVKGFLQRMVKPSISEMIDLTKTAIKSPIISGKFMIPVAKMNAVYNFYDLYPETPDMKKLKRWSYAMSKITGFEPDVDSI